MPSLAEPTDVPGVRAKQGSVQVTEMLADETLRQLQRDNFDLLARQEFNRQRKIRCIALPHLKNDKSFTEVVEAQTVSIGRTPQFFCRLILNFFSAASPLAVIT